MRVKEKAMGGKRGAFDISRAGCPWTQAGWKPAVPGQAGCLRSQGRFICTKFTG